MFVFPSLGKDIGSLICNVGSGVAAAGAGAAAGGGEAAGGEEKAEEKKEEKKEESEEESDDDMGFGGCGIVMSTDTLDLLFNLLPQVSLTRMYVSR